MVAITRARSEVERLMTPRASHSACQCKPESVLAVGRRTMLFPTKSVAAQPNNKYAEFCTEYGLLSGQTKFVQGWIPPTRSGSAEYWPIATRRNGMRLGRTGATVRRRPHQRGRRDRDRPRQCRQTDRHRPVARPTSPSMRRHRPAQRLQGEAGALQRDDMG